MLMADGATMGYNLLRTCFLRRGCPGGCPEGAVRARSLSRTAAFAKPCSLPARTMLDILLRASTRREIEEEEEDLLGRVEHRSLNSHCTSRPSFYF